MLCASADSDLWFRSLRRTPGTAPFRLFFFPCAGAGAQSYFPWLADLPPDVDAFILQLPGRGMRFGEEPATDRARLIDDIAAAVRGLLDRPSVFFGHSFGALLGFEVASLLRRQGVFAPDHLFVAGRVAPQVVGRDTPLHTLPDDAFLAKLMSLGGIPAEVAAERELIELLLPAIRADILLNESYVHADGARLDCAITALGGRQDADVPDDGLRAWQSQTSAGFALQMFGGGHFFVHAEREEILRLMAETVRRFGSV